MTEMPANVTKEKLKAGELALGVGLRQARTVDTAKIMQVCGFDWLFIDLEHNSMGIDTAAQMCSAGLDAGITPMVRSSHHASYLMSRPLDSGAQGIVAPHVDTVEEAERIAAQCLHPPMGKRSIGGPAPQLDYAELPMAERAAKTNENILVVCMIESPTGVADADAMAAVAGVDVLLIGTNDLCAEMGIAGQYGHENVRKAYETVASACANNGKFLGMGGVYDEELASKYIGMGAKMVLAGSDLNFLMQAAKSRTSFMRGLG
ncbi:MAG: aldolase [Alphaproteobacteria bacterium]|nr:aldolase [Alphaproteobacteria bacterium]